MRIAYKLIKMFSICFTSAALLTMILPCSAPAADGAARIANQEELKQQRKKAAHRRRRIIFNNDGDDALRCKEPTVESFLEERTSALLGTHVDTIFYSTTQSLGMHSHNTKVAEVLLSKEKPWLARNWTREFIDQGTDNLKMMVDFCHKNHIEIFFSMRMNDTHDASSTYGHCFLPQWKKDHPQWLLGSLGSRRRHGAHTAADYGRQEVRDITFNVYQEVCQNYDVDGIELDFFRHTFFFKRHSMGQDCGLQERDMMTGLLRRIRKMTETVGSKRGRPILVAVRVPDSVGYCAAIGLDIVRWMEDDLVDILVPSGYFRLNPWEVSVQLGHKYGVAVYPCLSESRIRDPEARKVRASLECYRGRAMNVWDSDADGVYLFNLFNPRLPHWSELGDPKVLETLDKVYCTGARAVGYAGRSLTNGMRFLNRQVVSPERPMPLTPGKPATVELRVGQHVGKKDAQGIVPDVKLRLRIRELANPGDLSVKLNDEALTGATKSDDWLEYPVSPTLVAKGANRFEIVLKAGSVTKPTVEDLLLWVRRNKSP